MILKTLVSGHLETNCYVIGDEETKEAVCIDPGDNVDEILLALADAGLCLKYIINTHGHFDHVGGNSRLKQATGAKLAMHKDDVVLLKDVASQGAVFGLDAVSSPPPDMLLKDGDNIKVGKLEIGIIHTPGHTEGGISLFLKTPNRDETHMSRRLTKGHEKAPHFNPLPKGEETINKPLSLWERGRGEGVFSEKKILFTGDTLFAGSIGRTDLIGGSHKDLIASIKSKILPLGDDIRVLPGHGPETTIGRERKFNQFL